MNGWAIRNKATGSVDMKTVHDSRRGAVVNWLYARARIPITQSMQDDEIEAIWQRKSSRETMVEAVEVRVVPVEPAAAPKPGNSEKSEPTEFGRRLAAMLHAETREALSMRDQDEQAGRIADLISLLAGSLGTAIAIAGAGQRENIDALLMGVENHIAETAAEKANDAKLLRYGYAVLGPDRQ